MLSNIRNLLLLITIVLTISSGLSLAEEPAETSSLQAVTDLADTLLADITAALANYDTAAVVSLLPEDIQIAMPGDKTVEGRKDIARYAPLLLANFGGCDLIVKREEIGIVVERDDVARDVAFFRLVRNTGDEAKTLFAGAYTIYFRLVDNAWTVERLFVGKKQ